MKARKILLVPLSIAALTIAAVCGTATAEMQEDISFMLTTKSVSPGHSTMTSLQQDPGFWEKEGLNAEILSVGGSNIAVQQIASGNAEFSTISPEVLLAARAKGVPIQAFYAIVPETIFRVVVPTESPISSPADLEGKTIGIPSTGSAAYTFARTLVASAGLDPDEDVEWLPVGVGAQAALALERGQVQALSTWDTMQAAFENDGMEFKIVTAPYVKDLIGQVLVAREDFLEEHPETAIAVARGIAKATIFALNNPEETVKAHWQFYPESKPRQGSEAEKLADAIHVMEARLGLMEVEDWPQTPYGRIDPEVWNATVQAAVEQNVITSEDAVEDAYNDNEWIEEINDFEKASLGGGATPSE